MYKSRFGRAGQISFENKNEYYQALGYLTNSSNASIHWENNELQGAWGSEGRIHFLKKVPTISGYFKLTAGRPGVKYRTNCNDFIENIVKNHNFVMGKNQNIQNIRQTIPNEYLDDFNYGLLI